ncbi:serine/threonine protein kinase, partial [Micromonospora phytophila]|nr:serine/threonine protein kinase [Micromonospora phytophila]
AAAPRPPASPPGYPRGAAPVPSAAVRQDRPTSYAGQAPPPAPRPAPRRSRSGTVFLAILLAALVLLCSGVISYNLRERALSGEPGSPAPRTVTSGALRHDGRDYPAGTSYRRQELPRPGGDETTSEGRQTR